MRTSLCALAAFAALPSAALAAPRVVQLGALPRVSRSTARPASSSVPTYTVSKLAVPSGYSPLSIAGIDNAGTVAVTLLTTRSSSITSAAATLAPTRVAPTSSQSEATAINATGAVVGDFTSSAPGPSRVPFVVRNGHVLALQGRYAQAKAVNDAGDVVGFIPEGRYFGTFPAIWPAGSAVPHQLGVSAPPGTQAIYPVGINDANVVVANLYSSSFNGPALLVNGTWTPLQIPGGSVYANALNAGGVVVGSVNNDDGRQGQAFVWDGTTHLLPMLPGTSICSAQHINTGGDVTGYCTDPSNVNHPFIEHAGTVYALSSLIASGPVVTAGTDGGINDAGQIVVYGHTQSDPIDAIYLFTPTGSAQPRAAVSR